MLDPVKIKTITISDNKMTVTQICLGSVENILVKDKNADHQHSDNVSNAFSVRVIESLDGDVKGYATFDVSSKKVFNLDESKVSMYGKESCNF